MSAHIAIRCDECGTARFRGLFDSAYEDLESEVERDGWTFDSGADLCPFCEVKRTARERAEAAAK